MRCAVATPFIMGDRVYGSVMDLIDETFPVPDYEECTEYEVGTLLHTKVPRFRTNATIFDVLPDDCFQVVTDIGNVLNVSRSTLEEWYLPPTQKRLKEWNV